MVQIFALGLIGITCGLVGGMLVFFSARELKASMRAFRWAEAMGAVDCAELAQHIRRHGSDDQYGEVLYYRPTVIYRYHVEGQTHVNSRLAFGTMESTNICWAGRQLLGKGAGAPIRVYYNPAEPSDSVLQRVPALSSIMMLSAGLIFIAAGFAIICAIPLIR